MGYSVSPSFLVTDACIASDHTPLVLNSSDKSIRDLSRFHFDESWFLVDGFSLLVSNKISSLLASPFRSFHPIDECRFCSQNLRKFLKGWGTNHAAEARQDKLLLSGKIIVLDSLADSPGLAKAGCA